MVLQSKTQAATSDALQAAEKKSRKELKQVDKSSGHGVQHVRKVMWFEKFDWFISSGAHTASITVKHICGYASVLPLTQSDSISM